MRKIKEYISNGKTTVDLIIHEKANNEQLSNEAILLSDFWKANLSSISVNGHCYMIHLWDKDDIVFAEAGLIFGEDEELGRLERTIIVMTLNKKDKTFPLIIVEGHPYFKVFVKNLVADTVKLLKKEEDYLENYFNYDMAQFERRLLGGNKMVLDEKGERINDDFTVEQENGSLVFSSVPPAAVDFII